jgi:hypothetical protein
VNIAYGVGESGPVAKADTYREAADLAKEREEHVWIVGDNIENMRLPLYFDRELIVDGQTFRTCVANGIEITGNFPKGANAPRLTLDFDESRVTWHDESGEARELTSSPRE